MANKKNSNLIILGSILNLVVGISAYYFTKDYVASGIWFFIGLGFLFTDFNLNTKVNEKEFSFFKIKKMFSVLFIVLAFSLFAYMLYSDFASVTYNSTGSVTQFH